MTVFDFTPSQETAWVSGARCADKSASPDMFPNELNRVAVELAKDWCSSCPVRQACLSDALNRNERHGIWGGLDASERNDVKRRMLRRSGGAVTDVVPGI